MGQNYGNLLNARSFSESDVSSFSGTEDSGDEDEDSPCQWDLTWAWEEDLDVVVGEEIWEGHQTHNYDNGASEISESEGDQDMLRSWSHLWAVAPAEQQMEDSESWDDSLHRNCHDGECEDRGIGGPIIVWDDKG